MEQKRGAGRELCLQSRRAETKAASSPARAGVPEAQQGKRKQATLYSGDRPKPGDRDLHTWPLDQQKEVHEAEGSGWGIAKAEQATKLS